MHSDLFIVRHKQGAKFQRVLDFGRGLEKNNIYGAFHKVCLDA